MPHCPARTTRFVLILLATALLIQPLWATNDIPNQDNPSEEVPATEEIAVSEEVTVVAEEVDEPTEMEPETEQLLSVPGAANDPLQAIYSLPGVTFSTSDGPGGSEPVIRGSAPQDNAYFIDQVPATYIFHLFGNSIFDQQVVGSFDLYPAAFSSEYGNATGGIIDVTLREPRKQSFTATLHTSLLSAGALVETSLGDRQSLYATYRRSTMDLLLDEEDIDDADDEGFVIDELPISDDYQLKYSWQIAENSRLSVVAAGASDSLAATFDEASQEALRDPDFAGPASLEQGFDSQGVTWSWQGNGRELTSALSHISDQNSLIYGRDQHETTDSDRMLARASYWQAVNDRHLFSAGLRLEDTTYDLDFNAKLVACNDLDPECSTVDAQYVLYRDTLDVFSHELYMQDRWSISDKQAFTLGFNYSSDNYLDDGRVEPRLRFDYQIHDKFSTYLSAGQYSQLPQLREMIEVLGNPNLTTVKSNHYVWGMSQIFGGGWRWGADLYYKDMTDVVISAEQDSALGSYSNGAEGSAYGVEFLLRKDLTDRWYGWASLSLSESDRTHTKTGETVRFEHDKPVLFNLVGNRRVGKSWMFGFRWTYQSGGRYTPIVDLRPSSSFPDVLEPVYGKLNSEQLPDYHRLDLRAEYTRPKSWGHWKFYVDLLNAYDQKNVTAYEYAANGRNLIPPPAGFGPNVPVRQTTSDRFFPSIGFEIRF